MTRAQELLAEAGENGVMPPPWNYTDAANAALYDDTTSGFYWTPGNVALAVEAVNALAAYEAAREALERLVESNPIDSRGWSTVRTPLIEGARAALARLRDEVPALTPDQERMVEEQLS